MNIIDMNKYKDYKLCYVDGDNYPGCTITLYFTELENVQDQWGDDWDDRPYEHNAEPPYEQDYSKPEQGIKDGRGVYPEIGIYKVIVTGAYNILLPCSNTINSPYSVEDINKGVVPWLTILDKDDKPTYVKAGTTMEETLKAIKAGREYVDIYGLVK